MRKGNPNHPKKGSSVKVDPIRSLKDISKIKEMLSDKPRDFALFVVGINTALRASDLLQIKAGQVQGLKPMDEIELKEKKKGKYIRIPLNKACIDAIQTLLKSRSYVPEDPLFIGQRGCLTVQSVHRLVKSWCKAIKLKGNFGSHTFRKTFGYCQRFHFGMGLPELMKCFNHSHAGTTLEYLGVSTKEIKDIYSNQL